MAARIAPANLYFTDVPVLVCNQGIGRLDIDSEIASQDAKHWWKTGLIPLRPSPIAQSSGQTECTLRHSLSIENKSDSTRQCSKPWWKIW